MRSAHIAPTVLFLAACGRPQVEPPDSLDSTDAGFVCPSCPMPADGGDIPCDVAAVLSAKCWTCHKQPPAAHAPFPLITWEYTAQPLVLPDGGSIPRYEEMCHVIQPDNVPHMPFGSAPQLTAEEFQTLQNWLAQCAPPVPEGTGCDADGG